MEIIDVQLQDVILIDVGEILHRQFTQRFITQKGLLRLWGILEG